eukprot:6933623-Ditylum_brightwellii.AAC.1
MTILVLKGWKSRQIHDGFYYKDSDSIYKFILHLKRNLYGLKQASYNWIKLLKAGLLSQGYTQSKADPYLYLKDNIICIVCVDDTIFYLPNGDAIDREISSLKRAGFDLTDKGYVNAFLSIQMSKDKFNNITMMQPALLETIIKLLN